MKRSRLAMFTAVLLSGTMILAQPPGGGDRGPGQGGPGQGGPGQGGPGQGGPGRGPGGPGGRGQGGGFGGFGGRGFMPPSPVMAALDADRDGVISPDEINNAVAALKTLDRNGNGKLEADELRPAFGGRGGGPGGGRGPGDGGGGPPGNEETISRMMNYDENNDSKLSKEELPERLQSMFARADKDEDGFLTREEISADVAARQGGGRPGGGPGGPGGAPGGPGGGRDMVSFMLERYDADGDEKLSGDEIPDRMKDRIGDIDTNDDKVIDKAELTAMAQRFSGGGGRGGAGGGGPRKRPPLEEE